MYDEFLPEMKVKIKIRAKFAKKHSYSMYSYVTRMYSYVICMYSYVTRMLLVCTRMYLYVTRMYLHVTRRMYSCGVLVMITHTFARVRDCWCNCIFYYLYHIISHTKVLYTIQQRYIVKKHSQFQNVSQVTGLFHK